MKVKVCGLTTTEGVQVSSDSGADYLGFVSCHGSVRHLGINKCAALMAYAKEYRPLIPRVLVMVNPSDKAIDDHIKSCDLTHIQLHGDESPQRLSHINRKFGIKLIKAIGISELSDLNQISEYDELCEAVLLDAKPPKDTARGGVTGGHGTSFEWSILKEFSYDKLWFLAGGLDEFNVKTAARLTKAPMVDVSSSLEISPGIKEPDKISRFLKVAKSL
jgi:phosphoribosylanthranilate isomerase